MPLLHVKHHTPLRGGERMRASRPLERHVGETMGSLLDFALPNPYAIRFGVSPSRILKIQAGIDALPLTPHQ